MTDEEIIRKAVELAEGWSPHDGGWGDTAINTTGAKQKALDALAAQLVRQVDAMGGEVWPRNAQTYFVFDGKGNATETKGPDRTMNTLRAIVESGVLQATSAVL